MTELKKEQVELISLGFQIRSCLKRMDYYAPSNEKRTFENEGLRKIWNNALDKFVERYIELTHKELENMFLEDKNLIDDMQLYLEDHYDDFLAFAKEYIINL